jgi:hypothetical protein
MISMQISLGQLGSIENNKIDSVKSDGIILENTNQNQKIFDVNPQIAELQYFNCSLPGAGTIYQNTISGQTAFVACGVAGMYCVNISDPTHPQLMSTYDTTDAYDVAVVGDVAFIADYTGGIKCVNVSNPNSPTSLGSYNPGGMSNDIYVDNNIAYVAVNSVGMVCLNVTFPSNPTLISSIATGGQPYGIDISGNVAYLSLIEAGVVSINITDPYHPAILDSLDIMDAALKVKIDGPKAYITDRFYGFRVLNVSNPSDIISLSNYPIAGETWDIDLEGDIAYVAAYGSGLKVLNISVYSNIFEVASLDTEGYAAGVTIYGNYAYISDWSNTNLVIVEIIKSEAPTLLHTYNTASGLPHQIEIVENVAFVTDYESNLFYSFNISNPKSIQLLDTINLGSSTIGFSISGSIAYVSATYNGIYCINISNPNDLTILGQYNSPDYAYFPKICGNVLYLADRNGGLLWINVSNPTNPFLIGSYPTAEALDLEIVGQRLYLTIYTGGVKCFNISNPINPTIIWEDSSLYGFGLDIQGDLLYFPGSNKLQILKACSNTPTSIGNCSNLPQGIDVDVKGNIAYLGRNCAGVSVIDISNPFNPTIMYNYSFSNQMRYIKVVGNIAYIAFCDSGGLRTLKIGTYVWDYDNPTEFTNPSNLSQFYETSGSYMEWTLKDPMMNMSNNPTYSIWIDGTTCVQTGSWSTNQKVTAKIPSDLSIGTHSIEVRAFDGIGANDTSTPVPIIIEAYPDNNTPAISYSTFIGGSGNEMGGGCIDFYGNYYISGQTGSSNFPILNAYDSDYNGGTYDLYLSKFSPNGSLIWSTYLGGSGADMVAKIKPAVDLLGNVYISGYTDSTNFPMINSLDDSHNGGHDLIVAKFNSNGNLLWSRYLGGTANEGPEDLIIGDDGYLYITGYTASSNFPMINSYDSSYNGGGNDIFVAKLNPFDGNISWSSYLGGAAGDNGMAILADKNGNCLISGVATDGATIIDGFNSTFNGGDCDFYIAQFNQTGSLVWSTYIGGSAADYFNGMSWNKNTGEKYFIGSTYSSNFPVLNAYDNTYSPGNEDLILFKIDKDNTLIWSTFFGTSNYEAGFVCEYDDLGNLMCFGTTRSTDFQVLNGIDNTYDGGQDTFLLKFDKNGQLIYSSLIGVGTTSDDCVYSGFVDLQSLNIIYFGYTQSGSFPTINAFDPVHNGAWDATITKFGNKTITLPKLINQLNISQEYGTTGTNMSWILYDTTMNFTNNPRYSVWLNDTTCVASGIWHYSGQIIEYTIVNTLDVGNHTYTIRVNDGTGLNATSIPTFVIIILNEFLPQLWNQTWGTSQIEYARDVCELNGYLYMVGHGGATIDQKIFLVKFDQNHNQIWNRTWDGASTEESKFVLTDGSNIYVFGVTQSIGAGNYDVLLTKWDENGNNIWNQTWGKSNNDYIEGGFCLDSSIYTVGYTNSYGNGSWDIVIIKWDTLGNQIWNRSWGGAGSDIGYNVWANNTDVYVCGSTTSYGAGSEDCIIIRYDINGNLLWNITWGGLSPETAVDIYCDGFFIYSTGCTTSFGSGGNHDLFVNKYYPNGTQIWYKTWGNAGIEDQGRGIIVTEGGIYIAGYTSSIGAGSVDVLFIKFDLNGNQLWFQTWGGLQADASFSLGYDGSNFYLPAWTQSFTQGSYDFALIKYGNSGSNMPPSITSPEDQILIENTSGHIISWIITDNTVDITSYSIYCNGTHNNTGTWESSTPITIGIDCLSVGYWNWTIIANDGLGSEVRDEVWVHVENNIAPSLNAPADQNLPIGTSGQNITWIVNDTTNLTTNYWIYIQGIFNRTGTWITGQPISFTTEGMGIGNWNVTIIVSDGIGANVSDEVWVEIYNDPPNITSPADVTYIQNQVGHNITWTVTDSTVSTPMYSLYRNGTPIGGSSWASGVAFNVSVDGLGIGYWNITIIAVDAYGGSVADEVWVHVVANTNPTLSSPEDWTYVYGTTNHYLNWTPSDPDISVTEYFILRNGTQVVNGLWTPAVNISANIEGLSVGYYNFTLILYDGLGGMVSDEVWGYVEPSTVPVIDEPSDQTILIGSPPQNITWTISDITTDNPSYVIFRNGTQVDTNVWISETPLIYYFSGLAVGSYNFTIIADDGYGNTDEDMVIVNIINAIPTINSPFDFNFTVGTDNQYITWVISDPNYVSADYNVFKDGQLNRTGVWVSGQEIIISVNGLGIGTYNWTIIGTDGFGGESRDEVWVTVTNTLPTINHPTNLSYVVNSTGYSIDWVINDPNVNSPLYSLYRNGTFITTNSWNPGQTITIAVNGMTIGIYNYSIIAVDGYGASISDTVWVTVTNVNPIISSPSDQSWVIGTTGHMLYWGVSDNSTQSPMTYTIHRNGTILTTGYWSNNGTSISINLDGLAVGNYAISCVVNDGFANGNATDVVIITVMAQSLPPTAPTLNPISPNINSIGNVTITWSSVAGATGYQLYRSTQNINTLTGNEIYLGNLSNSYFIDTSLVDGTYYYVVRAYNSSGYSGISNCENVIVQIPSTTSTSSTSTTTSSNSTSSTDAASSTTGKPQTQPFRVDGFAIMEMCFGILITSGIMGYMIFHRKMNFK